MLKPPYGDISDLLQTGRVVPFLGAGASLHGRSPEATWDPGKPAFLPNGKDLAHFLADESNFPSTDA